MIVASLQRRLTLRLSNATHLESGKVPLRLLGLTPKKVYTRARAGQENFPDRKYREGRLRCGYFCYTDVSTFPKCLQL